MHLQLVVASLFQAFTQQVFAAGLVCVPGPGPGNWNSDMSKTGLGPALGALKKLLTQVSRRLVQDQNFVEWVLRAF